MRSYTQRPHPPPCGAHHLHVAAQPGRVPPRPAALARASALPPVTTAEAVARGPVPTPEAATSAGSAGRRRAFAAVSSSSSLPPPLDTVKSLEDVLPLIVGAVTFVVAFTRLELRLHHLEQMMGVKLQHSENTMGAKMSAMENTMGAKMAAMEAKMAAMETKISSDIKQGFLELRLELANEAAGKAKVAQGDVKR